MQPSFEIIPSGQNSLPSLPYGPTASADFSIGARSEAPAFYQTGEVLSGVYEIRRLLGRGGMGQVYEAHDHVLDRAVAIKVAKPGDRPGRLLHEARALATLGGDGVPSVFGMGAWHGHEYCVMERVYGTTLARHIRRRVPRQRFTIAETVAILDGVAQTLVRVHQAGIIHRDLKPENIMLAPQGRIVLIDFGLYRTEGQPWDESGIWGSPRYIAPETITHQVRLGQEHLVDLYSLGVIGFFLLVGCPPFISGSVSTLLTKHVEKVPPRPSCVRADIPEALDRLVHEMLSKEPDGRPDSAAEVVARLAQVASS